MRNSPKNSERKNPIDGAWQADELPALKSPVPGMTMHSGLPFSNRRLWTYAVDSILHEDLSQKPLHELQSILGPGLASSEHTDGCIGAETILKRAWGYVHYVTQIRPFNHVNDHTATGA